MAFKFSIGYNSQPDFVDVVEKYRDRVSEVYFVAPYAHSARRTALEAVEYVCALRLHEMLKSLRSMGIAANMLFNALCIGDLYGTEARLRMVCDQVHFFRQTYGISAVTVVSPLEGEVIKRQFPDIQVHGSTNLFVRTASQAVRIRGFVDILTPDREINRDLDLLRAIRKALRKPLRILANEGCVSECPYRVQHLNRLSHETPPFDSYQLGGVEVFRRDPAAILKSPIIRPEDIHHYEGITDLIKLASRSSTTQQLDLILNAYTTERHTGDLFALMECGCLTTYLEGQVTQRPGAPAGRPAFAASEIPEDFFERVSSCDRLCDDCNYCASIAQRAFHGVDTEGLSPAPHRAPQAC